MLRSTFDCDFHPLAALVGASGTTEIDTTMRGAQATAGRGSMPEADKPLGALFKAQMHNMGSNWSTMAENDAVTASWDLAAFGNQPSSYFSTIVQKSGFFFDGEDLCSCEGHARGRPFLSTIDIFCCLVVFAWQLPSPGEPCGKGFGAHVNIGCLLQSCKVNSKPGLAQLTDSLKRHFPDGPVQVSVVGGQEGKEMEGSMGLKAYFPKDEHHWMFSENVLSAVAKAGLSGCARSEVDCSRLFPARYLGAGNKKYCGFEEMQAYQDGARFQFASLCLLTGAVYTHTRRTVRGSSDEAVAGERFGPDLNGRHDRSMEHNQRSALTGGTPLVDAGQRCASLRAKRRRPQRNAASCAMRSELHTQTLNSGPCKEMSQTLSPKP